MVLKATGTNRNQSKNGELRHDYIVLNFKNLKVKVKSNSDFILAYKVLLLSFATLFMRSYWGPS